MRHLVVNFGIKLKYVSVFLHSFDPKEVIDKLVEGDVNVFMAVPTVYAKLLEFIRKGTVILINAINSY